MTIGKHRARELQEARTQLEAEKAASRAIIDGLGVGLTIQGLDYRIVYENEMQQRLMGSHLGELCYTAYEGRASRCLDCPMVNTLQDGGVHRIERRIPGKAGDRHVELISSPLKDASGKITGGIKISKDITKAKQAEVELNRYRSRLEEIVTERTRELSQAQDQLRQAQKMEAIGQLAGGIAHDFNNILSAIMNCATIIQMETREDDPVRTFVDQILTSSERAANLTQSLLAFSRKQISNPQPIDVNEAIRKVRKLLVRLIGEDIELSTRLSGGVLTVLADSGQIEQVLMNLATNARDAMPSGGSLHITSEASDLGDEFIKTHGYGKPGRYAHIAIKDTGEGMEEEVRLRIFDPFYTTKEVGKGTGLGLSIVYGIVKQHNGYITVVSTPGKGAAFHIYLPLVQSDARQVLDATGTAPLPRGTETILIAEDDPALRELTRYILEKFGYRVIVAENGDDALRLFKENREHIKLIILDMIMPRKSGKDVYTTIRELQPAIKVLCVSGYTEDVIRKKGIVERDMVILAKPLSPGDLLRTVRAALDR